MPSATSWRTWATCWKTTAFEDAFRRFKDLADKKKHVFDEDIVALVDDEIMRGQDTISIKALQGRDRHRHQARRPT